MTDLATMLANLSTADAATLLQQLASKMDKSAVKAALKAAEKDAPTLLSVTMDCIVAAEVSGAVITADITKAVTAAARLAAVLKADEEANSNSVATLIRYAKAHDDAMVRAGYEWSKKTIEPSPEEGASEPSTETTEEGAAPATDDKGNVLPYVDANARGKGKDKQAA